MRFNTEQLKSNKDVHRLTRPVQRTHTVVTGAVSSFAFLRELDYQFIVISIQANH